MADVTTLLKVDGSVVNFDQQRKAARWQVHKTVQPLHHIDFPQRAVQVQRAGVDARRLNTKLPPVAGLGQGNVPHMVLKVKIFVLDPVRVRQLQRHAHYLAAKNRRAVQATLDMRQDAFEAHFATRCRGLVVNLEDGHIRVRMCGVGVKKAGFVTGELAHARFPKTQVRST